MGGPSHPSGAGHAAFDYYIDSEDGRRVPGTPGVTTIPDVVGLPCWRRENHDAATDYTSSGCAWRARRDTDPAVWDSFVGEPKEVLPNSYPSTGGDARPRCTRSGPAPSAVDRQACSGHHREGSVVSTEGSRNACYAVQLGVDPTRSLLAYQRHRYNRRGLLEHVRDLPRGRERTMYRRHRQFMGATDAYERAGSPRVPYL